MADLKEKLAKRKSSKTSQDVLEGIADAIEEGVAEGPMIGGKIQEDYRKAREILKQRKTKKK